jgi:CRP-like cAMP-binding protein
MTISSLSRIPTVALATQRFSSRVVLPSKTDSLWTIESGYVRALTWLDDGTTVGLGVWGPGGVVGKSLSTIEPYQIECLTKVEATPFPVAQLHSTPTLLLEHRQQLEELMVIRSNRRVDTMLLRLLNWLAKSFGQTVHNGELIDLRLTHQDLAELLGTTRVTVTRTLNQLEQQNLIQRLSLQRIVVQKDEVWHYEI